MFKNLHISSPIFKLPGSRNRLRSLDEKMDDIIALLEDKSLDAEKRKALQQRFLKAMGDAESRKAYMGDSVIPDNHGEWIETEMDIILSRRKTKKYTITRRSPKKHISKLFRIIISVLLITLGFAMIILPTPSSFEIYTLYYFNTNDGFTVMDLISLIIVFCGIYTLITVNRSRN